MGRVREAMRTLLNTISALPFEREDVRVAAQLRANLQSQERPIGAYDLLLASSALRRGLKIVAHDGCEFLRVGGLGVEARRGQRGRRGFPLRTAPRPCNGRGRIISSDRAARGR